MRKPFFVGMVHGLAGSAALMLLVLTTIPSAMAGLLYIVIFGFGSVGSMLVLSSLIGLPFIFTAQRFTVLNHWIRLVAGLASAAFGLFLGWDIGFRLWNQSQRRQRYSAWWRCAFHSGLGPV